MGLFNRNSFGLIAPLTEKQIEDYRKNNVSINRKKEFQTMHDLLEDAERYQQKEEHGTCYDILEVLKRYIEDYAKTI